MGKVNSGWKSTVNRIYFGPWSPKNSLDYNMY
jgi:hypothetical protein